MATTSRRRFLAGGAALLVAPRAAGAQQPGKVHRVGYLSAGSPGPLQQVFEQALHERGWAIGDNLVITYRHGHGKLDRLPGLAAELARIGPQVIVAIPTPAVRAARDVTRTVPIVMIGVPDPVGQKLIESFRRPGGNVTGVTGVMPDETLAKQLQLLKEAVPRAQRVAYLWNPANPAGLAAVRIARQAARTLGLELQVVGARGPDEFDAAFRAMSQARADALVVRPDPAFNISLTGLARLALEHRLPAMCSDFGYAREWLITYSVDRADTLRQAAGYVDRLLRGANPAELPVALPTKFELGISLKTAKALGLTIPPSLLARADQVIE